MDKDIASGTMFVAVPPVMMPMLQVVSSSMRPVGQCVIASAAMAIAFVPLSGAMPACAATPFRVKESWYWDGPAL